VSDWRFVDVAPENEVVETKIDDENGVRNVQTLKRRGNLWWFPDDSMYCYYRPTHWRPITADGDGKHE
jgi:hypothetical protein